MGARSPIKQRPRRGGLTCEFCSRSYPSAERLRAHQNSLHALALKEKKKKKSDLLSKKGGKLQKCSKVNVVSKPNPKPVKPKAKVVLAKVPEKAVHKESKTKQMESPVAKSAKIKVTASEALKEKKVEIDLKASTKVRKVEFKCPICIKMFPVYFSAMRHIQKHHSNKISSLASVVPIRTEFCIFCNVTVSDNVEDHKCESPRDLTGLALTYVCTGCDQKFHSMRLFDIHVSGVHSDGVESMFFPSKDEFNDWKNAMEEQTKTTYVLIGKYQYKHIYRCSKISTPEDEDATTAFFCPSTLIFQEYTKGIQVHYYREHYGHPCPMYVLGDRYKKYSITDMLHQAMGYSEITDVRSEEDDLYCQFKKLMESIVLDAAKINIETLKILLGRALEMITVLKNYKTDDEDERPINQKALSLSSNKINELTKAVESSTNTTKPGKRSFNTSIEVVPAKRLRNKTGSQEKSPILQKALSKPKITSNTFSLADDRDNQKILQELGGAHTKKKISPSATPIKKTVESPSFNDTYKHFVEKNLKTPVPVRNTVPTKKKVVVKTKMGQFKPGMSPNKTEINGTGRTSRSSIGKVGDIQYEMKDQENDKCKMGQFKPGMSPKTSINNSTGKTSRSIGGKYEIKGQENCKTKLKQLKPGMSPKKSVNNGTGMTPKSSAGKALDLQYEIEAIGTTPKSSAGKAMDIQYEIKEQENDCNILILKI